MPIYGYVCQKCGKEFELWQSMSDEPTANCPACGGVGTRLYYPAGVVFKGSGFYKTDSRSAPASTGSSAASTGADKKTDQAKPAGYKGSGKSGTQGTSSAPDSPAASKDSPTQTSAPDSSNGGSASPPAKTS